MARNYKFYERPPVTIRSNAVSGAEYAIQKHSDMLYDKLMEAEAVLKELQKGRRIRHWNRTTWLSRDWLEKAN